MIVKMLGCAVLAATVAVSAEARTVAQIGAPSNPPAASYKGQQFVDSRGCLFLRAGKDGYVNWVARIDNQRKPICGMFPTGSAAAQAAVVADMAPDTLAEPPLVNVGPSVAAGFLVAPLAPQAPGAAGFFGQKPSSGPTPTVYSTAAPPKPAAAALPSQSASYRGTLVATSVAGVQCYGSAPRLESVRLNGGVSLVCIRGDGTTEGWRAPMRVATAQPLATTQPVPVMQVTRQVQAAPVRVAQPMVVMQQPALAAQPVYVAQLAAQLRPSVIPRPPKGWKMAWTDDRLNPLRGYGTVEGEAQQDQVWQRSVPMVRVTDPLPKQSGLGGILGLRVAVATMSAPVDQVGTAARSIQIGSFAVAANAQIAAARLAGMGLPVSTGTSTRAGQIIKTVYVGPFASAAEARSGLTVVHGAGFPNAVLR